MNILDSGIQYTVVSIHVFNLTIVLQILLENCISFLLNQSNVLDDKEHFALTNFITGTQT